MSRLSQLKYACSRLQAFLEEIERLKECEFPYQSSEDALDLIEKLFKRKLDRLNKFDIESNKETVKETCSRTIRDLFRYLPVLGFLLRSTNVRNAFEVHKPLLRLAGDVLEPNVALKDRKTKLILSSEWDYSPYIYKEISDLPMFVLIGFPSSESSNPLLIPLSGHELGHVIWARKKHEIQYNRLITDTIINAINNQWDKYKSLFLTGAKKEDIEIDLFAREAWLPAQQWAMKQVEESFCDFIGLRIFGKSYLFSSAYLLSPYVAGPRSVFYPNMRKRITHLVQAANEYEIECPSDYLEMFEDSPDPSNITQSDELRLSLADEASEKVIETSIQNANDIINTAGIKHSRKEESYILEKFKKIVPAEGCDNIINILNAGWHSYENNDLWKDIEHIHAKKDHILKELVLKNIEVFEIEKKLAE